MTNLKVAAAVALALGGTMATQAAFAGPTAAQCAAPAASLYVAGSSAAQPSFATALANDLFDAAGEMFLSQFHHVVHSARFNQGIVKRTHLRYVREQFLNRCDSFGFVAESREGRGHSLEKVLGVAEEEIVLVAIMRVEGGAAHSGALKNILHGDVVEQFLHEQFHQRIA